MISSASLSAWQSVVGPVSSCEMCRNFCITASMRSHHDLNQSVLNQSAINQFS